MFWAHSDPDGLPFDSPSSRAQPLADHLSNVSRLAKLLAQAAAPDDPALHRMAIMAGLLHDYGKYTECFQKMIRVGRGKCPHSIFGAIAARQFGLRPGEPSRDWAMPVVHAIAAHHAGLRDHDSLEPETRSTNGSGPVKQQREIALNIWRAALKDQPAIPRALRSIPPPPSKCSQDLLTRMLLSCLVDADRLDTAGRANSQAPLLASERLSQLLRHLGDLHVQAVARGGKASSSNHDCR